MKTSPDINIDELKSALIQMEPPLDKTQAAFDALFPEIKASLDRGVTRKALLAKLGEFGLTLHPAKFKNLLNAAEIKHKNKQVILQPTASGGRK